MGWIAAAGLALSLAAALRLARIPRTTWEIAATAILLATAGYASQGKPRQPGAPRANAVPTVAADQTLIEQRHIIGQRLTRAWLVMSEMMVARGQTAEAVNILTTGVRSRPADADLWVGLANALVAHGDDSVTPAADYAYRHAISLKPEAAAPRYYYGLALARAGDLVAARRSWRLLVERTSTNGVLRTELQKNIDRIDLILAKGQGA